MHQPTKHPVPFREWIASVKAELVEPTDVTMVIDHLDDLFLHACLTEEQELADRQTFAASRARLFPEEV